MKQKSLIKIAFVIFFITVLACSCQTGNKEEAIVKESEAAIVRLYEENPSYSMYAVNVLKNIDHPFSITIIHKALEDKDWDTRYAAIMAAAELQDESSIPILQKIYNEGKGIEKLQAALSLAKLGIVDTISYLKENAVSKGGILNKDVIEFLAERGDESFIPALKSRLASKEISERNEVYIILGRIKSKWSLDMLKESLKKEWGANRKEVINAIGKIGEASEAKLIVPYINTQDLSLPTMFALGNLKNNNYSKDLKKYLKHKKKYARLYSAAALWRMDEEDAVKVIQQLFNETDPTFKTELAEQLSHVESNDVLPYLGTLSADSDDRVRKVAIRSMRDRRDPSLSKILRDSIDDVNYEVSVLAIDGVGLIGDRDMLMDLEPLLTNENGYIAISAAASIINITSKHPLQK